MINDDSLYSAQQRTELETNSLSKHYSQSISPSTISTIGAGER